MTSLMSYDFMRDTPKNLGVFLANIIRLMLSNDLFKGIKPEGEALQALYTPFWYAYTAALDGGKTAIDERNTRHQALLPQALKVARLVAAQAGTDTSIILAAGFKLRKTTKTATPEVGMPTNFTIQKGDKSGSVYAAWKGTGGSISFDIESRLKDETDWSNSRHTSNENILMTGYTPGTYVEFRVCGNGRGETVSDCTAPLGIWIN